jgi:hypothetical protein
MSLKVSTLVAAAAATCAMSAVAYGDTGKSPNGDPGPSGNPNPPAAQPQANGPQGPAGNDARGNSQAAPGQAVAEQNGGGSQGNSNGSNGNSNASHGNPARPHTPHGNHANPTPGTPRKHGNSGNNRHGQSNNFGKGKITICHATKSVKHPYVEITISVNGLHGHGPANDPRHHAGSWKDIIPAPQGGCPGTVSNNQQNNSSQTSTETTSLSLPPQGVAAFVAPRPEVSVQAPANAVLGARAVGHGAPHARGPQNEVLGANASGVNAPKAAVAARHAKKGFLPFTGAQLAFVLIAAAVALAGGIALRRALGGRA